MDSTPDFPTFRMAIEPTANWPNAKVGAFRQPETQDIFLERLVMRREGHRPDKQERI